MSATGVSPSTRPVEEDADPHTRTYEKESQTDPTVACSQIVQLQLIWKGSEIFVTRLYFAYGTLVIETDVIGVEADVVLVFVAFVLRHAEQHPILHLQPEFPMSVFQHRLVLLLGGKKTVRVKVTENPNTSMEVPLSSGP